MSDAPTRQEQIEKLAELIGDIRICMLTTLDPDGKPWSRPMATQEAEFDGTLWFFTRSDSEKVEHLRRDPAAGVAFAKPSDQEYVTMAGTAAVVDDRRKAEELWNKAYEAWFPEGLDDPHLRLVRVEVDRAEYWDSPSTFVTYAIGLAKAKLAGRPARDVGDNEQVSL